MKKNIILLSLAISTTSLASAQKESHTMHLSSLMYEVTENDAAFKLQLAQVDGDTYKGVLYDYSNTVKAEGNYILVGKKYLEDGHFKYFFQSGDLESEGNFVRGVKVGTWKRYDNNGNRKSDRYYPEESADKIREAMQMEKSDDEK